MALTAIAIISLRTPQFASDSRLTDLIALAQSQTSATAFGAQTDMAVALRVMHWLTLEARNGGVADVTSGSGASGALSSESEGQLSRSYNVSAAAVKRYPDLASTQWGMDLIALMNGCILGPTNRMCFDA